MINMMIITDHASGKRNVLGRVRLSVRLFPLYSLNRLIFDLNFCTCMGHDHSSPGWKVVGQGKPPKFQIT